MSKAPNVPEELLLSRRQRLVTIVCAALIFIAAGPILGWREALGAVITGVASLLVAVAIAEFWIHKRQHAIEENRRDRIRASLGDDLIRMSGFPLEVLATVLLDWGARVHEKVDPAILVALAGKLRQHFQESECNALAAHGGVIDAETVSEDQLESLGLPTRERMRWCAQAIVDHLLLYTYDVPGRLLESQVDEATADSTRRLARLLPDWKRLGEQATPYPSPSAFLSTVRDTLDACEPVLDHLETWPDDLRPEVEVRESRLAEPVFTNWPEVRRRHKDRLARD